MTAAAATKTQYASQLLTPHHHPATTLDPTDRGL